VSPDAARRAGAAGFLVNPMSGRDVRRLAARASSATLESKRDQLTRAVVGAAAAGVERILVVRDPFRIGAAAVEDLSLGRPIELLDIEARHRADDTRNGVRALREAGCSALVVFGGDGTGRVVSQAWPEAPLIALSTGTNNVFPVMVEATVAGAAAGLVASGRVPLAAVAKRTKRVVAEIEGEAPEVGLIDAVFLVDDQVGNFMPFDPDRIRRVVLARAEPAAVGASPIGGLLRPCGTDDDWGVAVDCLPTRAEEGDPLLVPISPGLYRSVRIGEHRRIDFGERVEVEGPGVLAFDGDRERNLAEGQKARLHVERDGPWRIDVGLTLSIGAREGHFRDHAPWHDHHDLPHRGGDSCC